MTQKTDWRGVNVGMFISVAGAGLALIFPTAVAGWALVAIGATGAVMAFSHRYVGAYCNTAIGVAMALLFTVAWFRFSDLLEGNPPGPRLEFQGIHAEQKEGYYSLSLSVANTSEIPAAGYWAVGGVIISDSENLATNKDVEAAYLDIHKLLKAYRLDVSKRGFPAEPMQVTRGMGVVLPPVRVDEKQLAAVRAGSMKMYVVLGAMYSTVIAPIKRVWVTEVCAKVTVPFKAFQSCPIHNRYYYANSNLDAFK